MACTPALGEVYTKLVCTAFGTKWWHFAAIPLPAAAKPAKDRVSTPTASPHCALSDSRWPHFWTAFKITFTMAFTDSMAAEMSRVHKMVSACVLPAVLSQRLTEAQM